MKRAPPAVLGRMFLSRFLFFFLVHPVTFHPTLFFFLRAESLVCRSFKHLHLHRSMQFSVLREEENNLPMDGLDGRLDNAKLGMNGPG